MIGRFAPMPALFAATLVLIVAACARDSYPSLGLRPDETRVAPAATTASPPAPPATPLLPSPELASQLAAMLNAARTAHAAFLAHSAEATTLIAAAAEHHAEPTTPPWSAANTALSRLTAIRAPVAIALAGIARLDTEDRAAHALADGVAGAPEARPDAAAIAHARAEVLAMIAAEDAVLSALAMRLQT